MILNDLGLILFCFQQILIFCMLARNSIGDKLRNAFAQYVMDDRLPRNTSFPICRGYAPNCERWDPAH